MNIKFLLLLPAVIITSLLLSQCRTAEGLGRDIRHVGNRIESTAERTSPY